MNIKSGFIVALSGLIVFLSSCTKDSTKVAATVNCAGVNSATNTFNLNIYPNITSNYCAYSGCHGGGTAQDGVDLSTYASTVSAFQSKNVICSLKNAGCILMPNTGRPLADSLILQMECWQQNGYPQ